MIVSNFLVLTMVLHGESLFILGAKSGNTQAILW